MRLFILFPLIFGLSVSASEPSVFGAGDLTNPNPYGLTHEEKLILENKKEIQTVIQKNNAQNAKVETVTERLDGMQGIIEGLSQRSNDHAMMLQKLTDKNAAEGNATQSLEDVAKQVAANTENIAQFKALLEELSLVVDGINTTYVTKEQFAALIKQLKLTIPDAPVSAPKLSNSALEKEANKLFGQKQYADAQKYFEQMIQKKHKTAEALFMLGETHFERKNYKEAVANYKESASRSEKALYMPTLLLHSGISMEKSGDSATAKAFYQATVSKYAGSGAAKEAQERLAKLK